MADIDKPAAPAPGPAPPPAVADDGEESQGPESVIKWRLLVAAVFAFVAVLVVAWLFLTVRFALRQEWVGFGVFMVPGLTVVAALLYVKFAPDSEDDEPAEPGHISEKTRKSWLFRAFLGFLLAWCLALTVGAMSLAVRHQWLDFASTLLTAILSWIGLAFLFAGQTPIDFGL